ncbi:MAG: hypothetical protein MJ200_03205 [Mycoplasmoidaceae bacterium]|nr:hypothetical protein [Mycoplasmoidaceae bacterium]
MKRKFILLPITLTALSPAISLVGCGGYTPEPKADVIIDLSVDASSSHDGPKTKTEPFFINTNKTYQFNIDAGICSSFEYATNESSF